MYKLAIAHIRCAVHDPCATFAFAAPALCNWSDDRYGLAADALISLGGLNAASRDGDGGEARRMLVLTKEAINDILTIGVNNDLNKK